MKMDKSYNIVLVEKDHKLANEAKELLLQSGLSNSYSIFSCENPEDVSELDPDIVVCNYETLKSYINFFKTIVQNQEFMLNSDLLKKNY